jgi:hypothetical protein
MRNIATFHGQIGNNTHYNLKSTADEVVFLM